MGRPVADYFGVTGDSPKVKHFFSLRHFSCTPILFHTNGNLILAVLTFWFVMFSFQVIGYSGNDDSKKYILDGEVTPDNIKVTLVQSVWFLSLPLHSIG